jgi:hypothetical protein
MSLGTGYGTRVLYIKNFSVADPDPGSGPGWTTRIIFPRDYKQFFGLKYLNSLMRIRDGENSDTGWKKFCFGINIPDPQHWKIIFKNVVTEVLSPVSVLVRTVQSDYKHRYATRYQLEERKNSVVTRSQIMCIQYLVPVLCFTSPGRRGEGVGGDCLI